MLCTPSDTELAALSKAIGHPHRIRILRVLAERNTCICGEIVAELPLSQATVSQHLKVLKNAGIIQGQIDGPRVCYCINQAALSRLQQLIGTLPTSPTETITS